ncbi:hypothetical protein DM01DRAFT_1332640 [Hesseltinella vesiculosa]|uniref:Biogenesis of lysosome-related organelles complex 1 subunit 5 n=1 Tax=Hesseltinella vesiculosa TaxID=101127 RepID=A0A1X2GSR5_9FUNG|nr:hypothetical protein DM01DRAFT_1332640 [Hesseltinella vesiculosa]
MASTLTTFVQAFGEETTDAGKQSEDAEPPQRSFGRSDLTKAFVSLSSCPAQLDLVTNNGQELSQLAEEMKQSRNMIDQTRQVLHNQEQRRELAHLPLQQEKQQYLTDLERRKKDFYAQWQHQTDKLEETFAKKTRDSIFRNLVGADQWFSAGKK